MANDPYSELGVSRTASQDEIRKAFRKLAKKHHPDANPDDKASEEKFKRAAAAFDIVGDPEKRKKFDAGQIDADGRDRHPGFPGGGGGFEGFAGGPFGGRGGGGQFEGVDLSDILGEMFGGRARGGGRRPGGFPPERGADVRARLEVELEETITGSKRRVAFSDGRTLDITIPKGATEGQVLRLREQGGQGQRGGSAGDALIELAIRPHPVYRREGEALAMDLQVSLADAVLGGKVQAPTPDGPVTLTIPRHSSSGRVLRLKSRGLVLPTGGRGDLLAKLMIILPQQGSPELDKLAEKLRKSA